MKNFEELKQAIRDNSFNESYLSRTQVVDLETVIGLIEDFEQCNIANVVNRRELLLDFADYSERDKASQTTDECVDNYLDSIK